MAASAESRIDENAVRTDPDPQSVDRFIDKDGEVKKAIGHREKFSVPGGGAVRISSRACWRFSSNRAESQISKRLPWPTSVTSFFRAAKLRKVWEISARPWASSSSSSAWPTSNRCHHRACGLNEDNDWMWPRTGSQAAGGYSRR